MFFPLCKLSHLTSLELDGADVEIVGDHAYRSVATLQGLCVYNTDLEGFTLQDCHNLEVLRCLTSCVSSEHEGCTLDLYCAGNSSYQVACWYVCSDGPHQP